MTLQRINTLWQLFSPPRRPHHHHHHHHHHHQVHSIILMIRTLGGWRGGDYFPALRCSHRHHPQLAASSSYNRWTLGWFVTQLDALYPLCWDICIDHLYFTIQTTEKHTAVMYCQSKQTNNPPSPGAHLFSRLASMIDSTPKILLSLKDKGKYKWQNYCHFHQLVVY